MKLNPDCVRSVLLEIENLGFNEHATISSLHTALPNYSEEDLEYTCFILGDGGFLNIERIDLPGQYIPAVKAVYSMTYKGHEFLSNIRSNSVWSGVKDVGEKLGVSSLAGLVQIAANVATELIKNHFGF